MESKTLSNSRAPWDAMALCQSELDSGLIHLHPQPILRERRARFRRRFLTSDNERVLYLGVNSQMTLQIHLLHCLPPDSTELSTQAGAKIQGDLPSRA
jgi:hypothetical protein